MFIGGVLLAAGMELLLRPGDYDGDREIRVLVHLVLERHTDWVTLEAQELASMTGPWRSCRLRVRVDALKRSLSLQRP